MQHDADVYLEDMLTAAREIASFLSGATFDGYVADEMLNSAVERKLLVIGEAMSRLAREFPQIASQIRDWQRIISFRNKIVHGYDSIDDAIVWQTVQDHLPLLVDDVKSLLEP
jgi:uncharacterized protein with HEPN domain